MEVTRYVTSHGLLKVSQRPRKFLVVELYHLSLLSWHHGIDLGRHVKLIIALGLPRVRHAVAAVEHEAVLGVLLHLTLLHLRLLVHVLEWVNISSSHVARGAACITLFMI